MGLFDWIKNIGKSVKTEFDGLVEEGKAVRNEKDAPPFMAKKDSPKWEPIARPYRTDAEMAQDSIDKIINSATITPVVLNEEAKEKYNLIVQKIKLRQSEINKLGKNSENKQALINELNNYKRVADRLKKEIYTKK